MNAIHFPFWTHNLLRVSVVASSSVCVWALLSFMPTTESWLGIAEMATVTPLSLTAGHTSLQKLHLDKPSRAGHRSVVPSLSFTVFNQSERTRWVLCSRDYPRFSFFSRRRHPYLSKHFFGPCNFAKRKSNGNGKTQEEVLDEDLRAGLNETVTEALKVMLAEDDKLLATFKEKVEYLGDFLVQDGQLEAARFMLILRGMLDHELYPEMDDLEGPYKKAFATLWGLLEDSGWLLTQAGAEAGNVPMVDDDVIPPVLQIRYSESN